MAKASEVEIRFRAEGPTATLVELEHSKLERHGEGYEQLRALFDGPGAWSGILDWFAKKIEITLKRGTASWIRAEANPASRFDFREWSTSMKPVSVSAHCIGTDA